MRRREYLSKTIWLAAIGAVPMLSRAQSVSGTVVYVGSDTLEPVVEAARNVYLKNATNVKVSLDGKGTGQGLALLCAGKAAWAGASRKINERESADCARLKIDVTELPMGYDAVVMVTAKKNSWMSEITLAELKRLFDPATGTSLSNWKQLRPSWPDQPLKGMGVGPKHGTFDFFSKAIGLNGFIRSDYKDHPDHYMVAKAVAADASAIGFVPVGVANEFAEQLSIVPVDFGKGASKPDLANILDGRYAPLTRLVYLYINRPLLQKDAVSLDFVRALLKDSDRYVRFAQLVPLKDATYKENATRVMFSTSAAPSGPTGTSN